MSHGPIDVKALDTEFLVSSPYKWYGPHAGALYGKREVLESLPAYKVRPAHDRFETGTQNFEAIAATAAAVDYLASLGDLAGVAPGSTRRGRLLAGMGDIRAHEAALHDRLMAGLKAIPGVHIWGITDESRFAAEKAPTISVTIDGTSPRDAAATLGAQGIFTWDGDFYAQALIERLGLFETGGVLRLGIAHYNTKDEIDRLLEAIEAISVGTRAAVPSVA